MSPLADEYGEYAARRARLEARLEGLGSALVAFSGGVDSGVLLAAARSRLGRRAVGAIGVSPSLARRELASARAFAAAIGAELVEVRTDELGDPGYVKNAGLRCYHCKGALFRALSGVARDRGLGSLLYGENADDLADERAGRRAAREHGVLAPLAEVGFTKADVRRYARERDLALAEKPASPCLASRLPLLTPVTVERLARIEAAEEALRALGLTELRVRDHGARARVELGAREAGRADPAEIAAVLAPLGFAECELAAYVPPGARGGDARRGALDRSAAP
jgi:uncharacterized protein